MKCDFTLSVFNWDVGAFIVGLERCDTRRASGPIIIETDLRDGVPQRQRIRRCRSIWKASLSSLVEPHSPIPPLFFWKWIVQGKEMSTQKKYIVNYKNSQFSYFSRNFKKVNFFIGFYNLHKNFTLERKWTLSNPKLPLKTFFIETKIVELPIFAFVNRKFKENEHQLMRHVRLKETL